MLIVVITSSLIPSTQANPQLTLTVTTDKTSYYPEENVTIYGNLTLDGSPVTDGLVAIQVKNPKDQTVTIRTKTTGTPPSGTPYVGIRSLVPCNSTGGPKDSFRRGALAYFKLIVTNYDIEPREMLITVNTYYPNNVSFSLASFKSTLEGLTTVTVMLCIPVPGDAILGNSTAYGNAYADWPSSNGWPYCSEASATFEITNGGFFQSTGTITQQTITGQVNGNYNLTFQLAPQAEAGNNTIYATSRYYGEEISISTTFQVKMLGDVNGDGKVNYKDLYLLLIAYGSSEEDPNYNPEADFNRDGKVNYKDLYILLVNYGKTA